MPKKAPVSQDKKQAEIAKFKGESHSYSKNRPVRKVVSRYAR